MRKKGVTLKKPGRKRRRPGWVYAFLKRMADIFLSFFLTVLFLPVSFLTAFLIFARTGHNPFFLQERMGRNGKIIKVLKFRTMRQDAADLSLVLSPEELALYRQEYKLGDDPRLIGYRRPGDGTRCFGAILRRTSIDELPQLFFNILLLGNMSLVGPRPILRDELQKHYTPEEQKAFLSVKPGLTGFWQAYARNEACYSDGQRQWMELYYVAHQSVGLDIRILFRTVVAVLTKAGAK
ncbi:MAG: sugar transferase [Eubacteriales bacterium]|nr:sugar transferase [Eubacteriales bacterium]